MIKRRTNRKTEKRSNLLDRLQEESWQLELIVSGIVIFLLIGAYAYIEDAGYYLSSLGMSSSPAAGSLSSIWGFFGMAYYALLGMFLLHLAVRGMWIGAIGLRSVSGDFDYDTLSYPLRYDRFLRRRLGTYDDYIDRLERNASVTFSLAFLLFFAIVSIGLFFGAMTLGILLFTLGRGEISADGSDTAFMVLALLLVGWVLLLLLAGLLYLIDFLTFGWIKRRPWFGKVYYPVYRLMGWITLARLYRPFYYNIIDNPFGKRLVRIYGLLCFILLILTGFDLTPYESFPLAKNAGGVVHARQYLDLSGDDFRKNLNFRQASLASRYAEESYLELFVPHNEPRIRLALDRRFPELRPLTPTSIGFMTRIRKGGDWEQTHIDSTLAALSAIHRVYLNDSLVNDVPWRFYDHPLRKQPGLRYDIPVHRLARGEYWVRVEYQTVKDDTLAWRRLAYLSFLR